MLLTDSHVFCTVHSSSSSYVSAAEIHNFQNSKMVGEASMGESAQNETSLLSTLPKELPLEFFTEITSGFSEDRILRASAFGTFYTVRLL